MRVPIYPEDLVPQGAFRKLSRSIQNRWPGRSPIQLSLASEILSRALGYADYHALLKASTNGPINAEPPVEIAVRAGIAAAISQALTVVKDSSVPSDVLERYVETLPLKALKAFKATTMQSKHSGASTHPTPDFDKVGTAHSPKRQVKQRPLNPTSYAQRQAFVKQLLSSRPSDALEQIIHQVGHRSSSTTGHYVQHHARDSKKI